MYTCCHRAAGEQLCLRAQLYALGLQRVFFREIRTEMDGYKGCSEEQIEGELLYKSRERELNVDSPC